MMRGTIGIRDLTVSCTIGVLEEEQQSEQIVLLDLQVDYDFSTAVATDDVRHVPDYSRVVAMIETHLRERRYGLLESAAVGVVNLIANRCAGAVRVALEIRKPEALTGTAVPFARFEKVLNKSGENAP